MKAERPALARKLHDGGFQAAGASPNAGAGDEADSIVRQAVFVRRHGDGYAAILRIVGAAWPLQASRKPEKSWRSSADADSDSGCHCTPIMNQFGSVDSKASMSPSGANAPERRP